MKKRKILLSALTAAFVFSASAFAVSGTNVVNPSSVNAQDEQSYWEEFFDVETDGNYTFTSNKGANHYSSITSWTSSTTGLGLTFDKTTTLTYKQPVLVSSLTSNVNLVEFYPNPETKTSTPSGESSTSSDYEFGKAVIRLEGCDNPNEYIEITAFQSGYDVALAWVQVSTNTMDGGGVKKGVLDKTADKGTPVDMCFTAVKSKALSLKYDSASNSVLAFNPLYNEAGYAGVNGLVRKLDQSTHLLGSDEAFRGFESEYVNVSITFTSVTNESNPANVVITNVLNQSLGGNTLTDTGKPLLLFPEDIDEDSLPVGEKGTFYPMWDIIGYDVIEGVITNKIDYKVSYLGADGTSTPVNVAYQKELGGFTPTESGIYRVNVNLTDTVGNKADELVYDLKVIPVVETIEFALNGTLPKTASLGESITVPTYTVTGGSGNLNVDFSVMDNDRNNVLVANNTFAVDSAGSYRVSYKVSDYLGTERIFEYVISTSISDEPIVEDAVIPSIVKANNDITLNLPKAYDYSSYLGEKREVSASIEVAELVGTTKSEYVKVNANAQGKYVYTPSADAEKLYVRYRATSLIGNHEQVTADKEIKILKFGKTDDYGIVSDGELNKYFYNAGNNIVYKYEESIEGLGIVENHFYVNENGATLEYVNPVQSSGFAMGLNFDEGNSYFKKISVKLRDSENINEVLTFTFTPRDSSTVYMSTASNPTASISGQMYDVTNTSSLIYFKFKLGTQIVDETGSTVMNVTTFDNGAAFNGFSSGAVYLTITFDDVDFADDKVNRMRISQFYSQYKFTENALDNGKPVIELSSTINTYSQYLATVKIPSAKAYDLYSPNCDAYVSLKAPNGDYVLGSASKGVIANQDYFVDLDQNGAYFVTYTSVDERNNKRTVSYSINTLDQIKPTIEIDGQIKSHVKVGDVLSLPTIHVSDNLTDPKDMLVYVNLKTPTFGYKVIKINDYEGTYVFQQAGTYELVVFVMDSSSNYSQKSFVITVTDR